LAKGSPSVRGSSDGTLGRSSARIGVSEEVSLDGVSGFLSSFLSSSFISSLVSLLTSSPSLDFPLSLSSFSAVSSASTDSHSVSVRSCLVGGKNLLF